MTRSKPRNLMVPTFLKWASLFLVWACCSFMASAIVPDEQLQFADGLYVRGLYDLALDEYLLLSREAESFERMDLVLYRIGECHRRLNNPEAAERFFMRVLREFPGSTYEQRAAFRRAELFVTRGRLSDGLELFRSFLEKDQDPSLAAPAWYYVGYAARRLNDEALAEEAFRTVLEQHPEALFAAYAALELAAMYRENPDRTNEVPLLFERVLVNPPTPHAEAEALFQKAEWWFAQGDYVQSAEWYERLFNEHANSPRASEALLQAAWAFFNAGRYAEAAAWAREALEDRTHIARRSDWLYLLANCQRQLLNTDEAQQTYAKLIAEFPGHELARIAAYESTLMSFQMDRYEETIEQARQLPADPALQTDLHWMLAESYAAIGRTDEAVQYYRLILDAGAEDEYTARALFRLASILQGRKEYGPAARTYRQLADRFPADEFVAQALFNAGFCMVMENRYDKAVQDWDRLLKEYSGHPLAEEAEYQRALTLLQMEKHTESLTSFIAFLEKHPSSEYAAESHYWVGILHEQKDELAAAEEAYRKALATNPETGLQDRIEYRLILLIQKEGQYAEAADRLQGLLNSTLLDVMPPSLLDWLTRHWLNEHLYDLALEAAEAMLVTADSPIWEQIGWSLKGRALQELDEIALALEAFERSLQENARTREGAEAAWTLGSLNLKDGNTEVARGYLQRAAEIATDDRLVDIRARSYFALAQVAAEEEDWSRAARLYLSVGILFEDPDLTPSSLYYAAQALSHAGRQTEAAHALQELKKRYPDSEWAEKAQKP